MMNFMPLFTSLIGNYSRINNYNNISGNGSIRNYNYINNDNLLYSPPQHRGWATRDANYGHNKNYGGNWDGGFGNFGGFGGFGSFGIFGNYGYYGNYGNYQGGCHKQHDKPNCHPQPKPKPLPLPCPKPEPKPCPKPEPKPCPKPEPTPCPPPPPTSNKVLGSAGLFGDPKFGLFTPNLNAPNALKSFESNIKAGQTVNLINDPDRSGFKVDVTGVQVDPRNPNTIGIGQFNITSGNQSVLVKNDGTVTVGSKTVTLAQLKQMGGMTLDSGAKLAINNEIDGYNGQRADRLSFQNGEYKITAAFRNPHSDSANYFDMNFEELTKNAADNATGYKTTVAGLNQQYGIVDLLRMEPPLKTV